MWLVFSPELLDFSFNILIVALAGLDSEMM